MLRLGVVILCAGVAGCQVPPWRGGPHISGALEAQRATLWVPIGESVEGRVIEAATLGHGPLRVYIIGAIHGDEAEGLVAIDPLAHDLDSAPLASLATTRMVRNMNPDGTAAAMRGNARGIDLNRNWPAANFVPRRRFGTEPLSEPETAAVHADLQNFDPHVIVVFHSARTDPFVNFDGPAGELAAAFAAAASLAVCPTIERAWRIIPAMTYPTPGSLGTYMGVDGGVPILTIEFRRGQDAESVLPAARAGVEAVIRGVLPQGQ
jgi:murein peptide amidase A